MPTTYAHWRFGADCIETMPDNLKKICLKRREIFDIGLHGPDIFFYDLMHKDITRYGYDMHGIPVEEFFKRCKGVYDEYEEKESMMAYMLGFLSHFTLDSVCHGYVERKKEESDVTHNRIESEWDRHVIELDNRATNLVDRSESLKPRRKNARIISYFFPFNPKQMMRVLKWQKNIVKALNCISKNKEDFMIGLLKFFKADNFADLFIGFKEYEPCKDSNLRLDKLEKKAVKLYPKLCKNLVDYLTDETNRLNPYFKHDFGPWEDYKDIQVLDYEEELKYKV